MDVLAIFLGLIVIWADDILRTECHLVVETGTTLHVAVEVFFAICESYCGGVISFFLLLLDAVFLCYRDVLAFEKVKDLLVFAIGSASNIYFHVWF